MQVQLAKIIGDLEINLCYDFGRNSSDRFSKNCVCTNKYYVSQIPYMYIH